MSLSCDVACVAAITAGAAVVAAAASLAAQRARGAAEGHAADPARDHVYGLAAEGRARHEVRLEGGAFPWPATAATAGTALLVVRVRAGALPGRLSGPWIEAAAGGQSVRQDLEPGARGARYLNLSGLLGPTLRAGDPVALAGRGARVEEGPCELLLFEGPSLEGARILVVAPHPDDAEIAAFGLYAHRDAHVVTLTAGDAAGKRLRPLVADEAARHRLMGALRLADSIGIPMLGGIGPDRVANLGYFDGTLDAMRADPTLAARSRATGEASVAAARRFNPPGLLPPPPARADWPSLVADLAALLERARPTVVALPHPLLDSHPDHRAAGLAVLEAAARAAPAGAELWLYVVHHVHAEAHPAGPRGSVVSLGPWYDGAVRMGRVVSLPLPEEARTAKLFALEASHDIRPAARPDYPGVGFWLGRALRRAWDHVRGADPERTSYLRRALRPNELFFVHPASEAGAMRTAFAPEEARRAT